MKRTGKQIAKYTLELPADYHKQIKLLAIDLDKKSVKELILEALKEYMARHPREEGGAIA